MEEQKHRMLYQGQDPNASGCQAVPKPPAYAEAITHAPSLRHNNNNNNNNSCHRLSLQQQQQRSERRCTFFAEPQHLRQQQQEQQQQQQLELESAAATSVSAEPPTPTSVAATSRVHTYIALKPAQRLGATPSLLHCPFCGHVARTVTKRCPSSSSHLWALALCCFGWCCCACLLPYYCCLACRATQHYCAACSNLLATAQD
ncbi:uncharacterized protein DDB_G0288467 [Drosophila busckii]|uniref:uncharacterized protein DDB_G0288467 n=1 Tax=Drosophila busckii TaxID=30019 RepID=UPI00083EA657|nr:uncharacterized protein DDB_G0288467 [Drosophila busckii]